LKEDNYPSVDEGATKEQIEDGEFLFNFGSFFKVQGFRFIPFTILLTKFKK